jgi:DNA repair protein RecO
LVLACADSNDDRIVRVLTEDDRLVPAVAKFARKQSKRRAGPIQPLTLQQIALTQRDRYDLARVDRSVTLYSFAPLKADLRRYALASTMAEVTLHMVAEHGQEPGIFALLERAWQRLDNPAHAPIEELLLLFELRLLQGTGTLPPFETLSNLSEAAQHTLEGWLVGRWQRLPEGEVRGVAYVLEALISDASGRQLKSRIFLNDVM